MPREVVVKKPLTVLLLLATTLAIVAVTVWMAGRSYENFEPIPFDDLRYLAKRLGRDVRMHTRIDESLLGGAIVRAGDLVIDGSLKGRLERLGSALQNQ